MIIKKKIDIKYIVSRAKKHINYISNNQINMFELIENYTLFDNVKLEELN